MSGNDGKLRFLDLFAGIGGIRLGLEQAGHKCVGHVEIDKFANESYEAIHRPGKEEFFYHDITGITDEHIRQLRTLDIDLFTGGFPCQAFSIAGARRGFEDTRGTLFFDIARLAREIKPKYLLLENVKGLLNHEGGVTFETILRTLWELGYFVEWQVLNSKYWVPQNRERIFIVGHFGGPGRRKVFPIGEGDGISDPGNGEREEEGEVCTTITATYHKAPQNQGETYIKQIGNVMPTKTRDNPNQGRVYDADGLSPALTNIGEGGGREPMIIDDQGRLGKKLNPTPIARTLRAQEHGNQKKIVIPVLTPEDEKQGFRIRKITPKEAWRLQGFPDWAHERAVEAGLSDTQRYKQAGNSVTVPVIRAIGERLREVVRGGEGNCDGAGGISE